MKEQYRYLKKGETIRRGDEVDNCNDGWRDEPNWVKSLAVGSKAPDPRFPSHRTYRRPIGSFARKAADWWWRLLGVFGAALLLACCPAFANVRYELADTEADRDLTSEVTIVSADLVAGQRVSAEVLVGFGVDGDATNGAELTIKVVEVDGTYGNIPIGQTLTYTIANAAGVAYVPIAPFFIPADGTYAIRVASDGVGDTSVTIRGILYEEGDWQITPSSDGPATDGSIRFDAPRGRDLYARVDQSTTIDLTASGTTYTLANADVVTAGVSGTSGTPVAHTITVQQQIGGSKLTNDPTRGEFYAEWNGSGWSTVYLDAATITEVASASATATDAEVADDFTSTGLLIAAVNSQASTAATQASAANAKLPADTSTKIGTLPDSGTVATTADLSGITASAGYQAVVTPSQQGDDVALNIRVLEGGVAQTLSGAGTVIGDSPRTDVANVMATQNPLSGTEWNVTISDVTLSDSDRWDWTVTATVDGEERTLVAPSTVANTATTLQAVSAENVSDRYTWKFPASGSSTTASNTVAVNAGFIGDTQFDCNTIIEDGSTINSVSSVTVSDSGATVGTIRLHTSRRRFLVPLSAVSTPGRYTVTATFVTADSQTIVAKGTLEVR